MWDIKLGKSKQQWPSCSATKVRDLGSGYSISENDESFWVTEGLLNIGFRAYCGTTEYDKLASLLDKNTSDGMIIEWINATIIRNATPQQIVKAIDDKVAQAYRKGQDEMKRELRTLIGVDS